MDSNQADNFRVPMRTSTLGRSTDGSRRTRCYVCWRPKSACYCEAIPAIDNKTELLILQHSRERSHPFNTARMAQASFSRSTLLFGNKDSLAKQELPIRPGAGVLFPSPNAIPLKRLPAEQRPKQLVVIDGTWSQAKSMVRGISQLEGLRHYQLAPSEPGKYRIRLEPTDTTLSTVEAIVEAMKQLEPETVGLNQLLSAFDQMVQRQLDHPKVGRGHYSGGPKSGCTVNIPKDLLGDLGSIVVVYGESGYRDIAESVSPDPASKLPLEGSRASPRRPLVWAAQRLCQPGVEPASPSFVRFLQPDVPLTDSFLRHLQLTEDAFTGSIPVDQFRAEWRGFIRPNDRLVAFNEGTFRLLQNISSGNERCFALKSINFDERRPRRSLSQFVADLNLVRPDFGKQFGRAGERLANAIALTHYLRSQESAFLPSDAGLTNSGTP